MSNQMWRLRRERPETIRGPADHTTRRQRTGQHRRLEKSPSCKRCRDELLVWVEQVYEEAARGHELMAERANRLDSHGMALHQDGHARSEERRVGMALHQDGHA